MTRLGVRTLARIVWSLLRGGGVAVNVDIDNGRLTIRQHHSMIVGCSITNPPDGAGIALAHPIGR